MILSEKIQALLRKWDFDQAKELYQAHGEDELQKFLFEGPYSEYLNNKLKEAIAELAQRNPIVQSEVMHARNASQLAVQNPKGGNATSNEDSLKPKGRITMPEDEMGYPKELQELVLKRKGLFAEANHARYILFQDGTPEAERKRLAFLIKANWREIERIWGILNFWKEHKTLSPDLIQVNPEAMNPREMEKRIRNLISYISKARSGKKTYKLSIEEMQAEVNELRRILDGIV